MKEEGQNERRIERKKERAVKTEEERGKRRP